MPRANTDRFGRRGFSVSGPNQWNKLPPDIRKVSDKPEQFARALKRFYFQTALTSTYEDNIKMRAIAKTSTLTSTSTDVRHTTLIHVGLLELLAFSCWRAQNSFVASLKLRNWQNHASPRRRRPWLSPESSRDRRRYCFRCSRVGGARSVNSAYKNTRVLHPLVRFNTRPCVINENSSSICAVGCACGKITYTRVLVISVVARLLLQSQLPCRITYLSAIRASEQS